MIAAEMLVDLSGFEPEITECHSVVIPFHYRPMRPENLEEAVLYSAWSYQDLRSVSLCVVSCVREHSTELVESMGVEPTSAANRATCFQKQLSKVGDHDGTRTHFAPP